jgi:hypothetical protein
MPPRGLRWAPDAVPDSARLTPGPKITYNETDILNGRAEWLNRVAAPRAGKDLRDMGVSFGRSRIADLSFQVFNRGLHPEWFATRAFRRVEHPGWLADLRIIEGGHAVVFRSGLICITEVLSGPETALPEPGLLFHSHLRHERSTHLRPGGRIEYQCCLEVERVDLEIFRHLCEEMILDASRDSLVHCFRSTDRLAPPPISHFHIGARASDLAIQSFHTFPEECAIVRTQSLFELKPSLSKR